MADSFSKQSASEPGVTPLQPGEDPLAALSPEMRELVLSSEPAVAEPEDTHITAGDRIKGMLTGIAIGGGAGFLIANLTPRRHRIVGAAPMNAAVSITFAGIGAAIGGVSGLLRGRSPLDTDERAAVERAVGNATGSPTPSVDLVGPGDAASAGTTIASHPAFASVHG